MEAVSGASQAIKFRPSIAVFNLGLERALGKPQAQHASS